MKDLNDLLCRQPDYTLRWTHGRLRNLITVNPGTVFCIGLKNRFSPSMRTTQEMFCFYDSKATPPSHFVTMWPSLALLVLVLLPFTSGQVTYQNSTGTILRVDSGSYGPPIEEVHYFYHDWPVGFAVSGSGRIFVSYYPGNVSFTLGEVVNSTSEMAYMPNYQVSMSNITQTSDGTLFGSSNATGFISVQALYVTPRAATRPETLWVLDTGRPNNPQEMAYALPGEIIYENLSIPCYLLIKDSLFQVELNLLESIWIPIQLSGFTHFPRQSTIPTPPSTTCDLISTQTLHSPVKA